MIKGSPKKRILKNQIRKNDAATASKAQSTYSSWLLKNLDETTALGAELIQRIPNLRLLLLEGPLGVGKTSLVKGMAVTLGIKEPITSPTFPLAQHYLSGKPPLFHLDLYRLENHTDAEELFIQEEEEAQDVNGLMVIEWPERLHLDLPEAWKLKLEYMNEEIRLAKLIAPKI
tara:strand:+ start:1679 stop:2197 length:519 start_codon:yes stop_codon:yes gene_type:complete